MQQELRKQIHKTGRLQGYQRILTRQRQQRRSGIYVLIALLLVAIPLSLLLGTVLSRSNELLQARQQSSALLKHCQSLSAGHC